MNKIILVWIGLGLLIGGCSLSPKYEQPKANLPKDFGVEYSKETISQTWWKDFGDEYLNGIVEEALKNNYDLAVAMERVSQARSSWSYARSDRYPSLSAQGEATRNKKNPRQGEFDNYNNFSLSGILSFELDLWGRARDADRSAYATLLASKANRDTIRLSLIASVVESYFGILTLNNQVQISQNTLVSREESYQYRKKEFEAGKISEIDMQQARSEMASVRAQLQSLLMERNAAQTALMILLGRDPQGIFNIALPVESQMLPKAPKVPVGLPSTLLENRPDIEAAEQNLKAANFSIGVARAAYFPTISLTGLIGYASPELNELFNNSSSTWNYGGNFVGNVIDFGRTSANVELTKSQYREMLLNYGQTLRQAFGEVRDSLYNYSMSFERLSSLNEQVEALRRTLVLAELRYREGYTNYLEVLTTQSNLFAAELTQQSANLENLSSVINIYKAFGGGWDKSKYAEEE
ncbi:efflux transporter outer membrane subunit [Helicobacter canadensis]|uniref:TolC-like outer membrane protein channel n=1 Tax=Helicobacter canadensis MIT 98-5491 TaxID=537970 RepID=C5ZYX1_9HELI|nr:efflux transporter outer membrane subunit [Helicobacter canadensis]EES89229.1 putative TolC-like outer membrane protein channel [Helicobacter canadensis MIT 98-5491]EFR48013.1 efflux transporter, outer membrane factor lipoprotein, NodT family [Helicobacter canadensis MIT 98-5491]STO99263.1 RND efflux system outer membrane lipoprotein CmeC [Helicobacter canadensis]